MRYGIPSWQEGHLTLWVSSPKPWPSSNLEEIRGAFYKTPEQRSWEIRNRETTWVHRGLRPQENSVNHAAQEDINEKLNKLNKAALNFYMFPIFSVWAILCEVSMLQRTWHCGDNLPVLTQSNSIPIFIWFLESLWGRSLNMPGH